MNTKIIIAAVVGSVAAFLLGWVIWGMLLMEYFQANSYQYEGMMLPEGEMKLWAIYLSNLAFSFLLAWLFDKMNITTLAGGLQCGAIINFIFAFSMAMMFYSMMNWYKSSTVMIVDVVVNAAYGGIVGAVIALTLGKAGKSTA